MRYRIEKDTLTGLGNAIRRMTYDKGNMTPAQMAAKINSCKLGIPIDLTTHINLATKKWVRPEEYPDLDSITIGENEEVVYMTYDLRKTPGYGWIGLFVANVNSGTKFYIERGHLENGAFVADYTVQKTSDTSASSTATSVKYFREALDEENGLIQLWRVRSEDRIASLKFCCRSTTKAQNFNFRLQPCVERVGQLGYITSLGSTSTGTDYTLVATSLAWCTLWMEREKMTFTGKAACTSLSYAYASAYSLQELDMSGWDTEGWAVTNMAGAFSGCYILPYLDLTPLDVRNWAVTTLAFAWQNCYALRCIDFTGWDTGDWVVNTLESTFQNCYSLAKCNYTAWDVSKWRPTKLNNMFRSCYSLPSFDFTGWDTSDWNMPNLTGVFASCYSARKIDLTAWDVSNWAVTTMTEMFRYCYTVEEIDLTGWDTTKFALTSVRYMFEGLAGAKKIKFPNMSYNGNATNLGTGFPVNAVLEEWNGFAIGLAHSYANAMSLKPESLVSILTRLKTVTAATTVTLGQQNRLKLTAEQIAIATQKGWTVA